MGHSLAVWSSKKHWCDIALSVFTIIIQPSIIFISKREHLIKLIRKIRTFHRIDFKYIKNVWSFVLKSKPYCAVFSGYDFYLIMGHFTGDSSEESQATWKVRKDRLRNHIRFYILLDIFSFIFIALCILYSTWNLNISVDLLL